MSNDYVVTSKEVRPGFTAELLYDENTENPREWGSQIIGIYFWDDKDKNSSIPLNLSDLGNLRSYKDAIRELYQEVYPELVDCLLEEEPPQEILDLIDQTPYPGIIQWIEIMNGRTETLFVPMLYPDTGDPRRGGVAFISDEKLQEDGFTREEGEILIQNNLLELEHYINGNSYLLKIDRDDEIEYYGGIYPTAETDKKVGRLTLLENIQTPRDEDLDNYLLEIGLEMGMSPEEKLLILAASWD